MTNTTHQPGDGLPPSEPTQDIGEWPLIDDFAAMAADPNIQREMRAINAEFEAALLDGLDNESMTHERVDTTDYRAERDALAAKLAAVQAYVETLPSEKPEVSAFSYPSEMGNYGRTYGKYEVRQALDALLKEAGE